MNQENQYDLCVSVSPPLICSQPQSPQGAWGYAIWAFSVLSVISVVKCIAMIGGC